MSARSAMLAAMPALRTLLLSTLVGLALCASACRDPQELAGSVTAILVVVDLDEEDVVEVDIVDRALRATPKDGDNLVAFNLPLPVGSHTGAVVVLEPEDEGERPKHCGPVTIVVPEAASEPVLVAVVAEDLGECPGTEDEVEIEAEAEPQAEPESEDGT